MKTKDLKMREEKILLEAFIDCPVCYSGNYFDFDKPLQEVACEDCGFILADISELKNSIIDKCIFCGNQYFYFEYPLGFSFLSFLGKKIVCYLCEATYFKDISPEFLDQKYNSQTEKEIKNSGISQRLKKRINRYCDQKTN